MKLKLLILSVAVFFNIPSQLMGQKWVQVKCGGEFSMGIKSDGSLWAWGRNANGQLGIGGTVDQTAPYHVGNDKDWKEVYAGGSHVIAIKNNGTLWSWGNSTFGQTGQGSGSVVNDMPQQVGTDSDWVKAAAGYANSYFLKKSGVLYACGFNFFGEVGDSSTDNIFNPKPVFTKMLFKDIACGSLHAVAIATDGSVWAWGYGQDGELGQGITKSSVFPIRVGNDTDWVSVSAGGQETIALKKNGTIWSWGGSAKGQLGLGSVTNALTPTQIGHDSDWQLVSCASEFAFAIKKNNTLYAWGDNTKGEIALTSTTQVAEPERVDSSADWISISGSTGTVVSQTDPRVVGHHAIGLKSGYDGYCATGINNYAQLGIEDTAAYTKFDCTLGLKSAVHIIGDQAGAMRIYPNPSAGHFSIVLNNQSSAPVRFIIRDITGKTNYQGLFSSNHFEIDLTGCPKGIYFMELFAGGRIIPEKIVLE